MGEKKKLFNHVPKVATLDAAKTCLYDVRCWMSQNFGSVIPNLRSFCSFPQTWPVAWKTIMEPVLLHWGLCYQSGCDVWLRALFRQSCLLQLRDITKVKTVLIPSRPWKSSILSTHHIWACKSLCVSLSQKSPNSKRQTHIAPIHVTPNSLSVIVDLILYFPQLPL